MILKHSRKPVDGQPTENTFYTIDPLSGDTSGKAVIYANRNPELHSDRPLQVRIHLDRSDVPELLLGAALARAREICHASNERSRIFVHCNPGDSMLMDKLSAFGFKDNDALVRMQLRLPTIRPHFRTPAKCTVRRDDLSNPSERSDFLKRHNKLFNADYNDEWLKRYIDRENFMRIVVAFSEDIAGEILIWKEQECGVIGYIQTYADWRGQGIASHMISMACDEFDKLELYCAEATVRVRYPIMLKLMENAGFKQAECLMKYPGIDINP